MDIPAEADWRSEAWCLDCESAYKRFAGKTREEAMAMFADNALLYQEDVMFMPKRCFGFYAIAYAEYLTSDLSFGEDAGASCFVGIVEIRHAHIRRNARRSARPSSEHFVPSKPTRRGTLINSRGSTTQTSRIGPTRHWC